MYEFFIEMDCLGAYSYNVQQTENLRNLKSQNLGGGYVFYDKLNTTRARNFNA